MARIRSGEQTRHGIVGSSITENNPQLSSRLLSDTSPDMEQQISKSPEPRLMTPEEKAVWGPILDLRKESVLNRSRVDPASLAPYVGEWVAWSPDGTRIVAHAEDLATLDELVVKAGEDPALCTLEGIDD